LGVLFDFNGGMEDALLDQKCGVNDRREGVGKMGWQGKWMEGEMEMIGIVGEGEGKGEGKKERKHEFLTYWRVNGCSEIGGEGMGILREEWRWDGDFGGGWGLEKDLV
jgi:hypothetical protein